MDPPFKPSVVRQLLAKRGMTLRAFAKEVGVHPVTLNSWLSGYIRNPKAKNLRRVNEFLGLPQEKNGHDKKEATTGQEPLVARENAHASARQPER